MDSPAQELIDEIIDHIPLWYMPASSLVARCWRCRGQQRHFELVKFSRYEDLALWEKNIPQDPDGIHSYVRRVTLQCIPSPFESTRFSRLFETFKSIVSLTMAKAKLPEPRDLAGLMTVDGIWKGITSLTLVDSLYTPFTSVVTFILSFPNLKALIVHSVRCTSNEPPPILPDASQREPLELLAVEDPLPGISAHLAKCRFKSRMLVLNPCDESAEQFIALSSEIVVALTLMDRYGFFAPPVAVRPPAFHLPPLPSLTRIRADLSSDDLSPSLAVILSSIRSAPKLSLITFSFAGAWFTPRRFPSSGDWVVVDKWLAWFVTARTAAEGSLSVVIAGWLEGNSNWEGYFPEFRRAGGELRMEVHDHAYWNMDDVLE